MYQVFIDLYNFLPLRWLYLVGWLTTWLLTIYPITGRRLTQDDFVRLIIFGAIWWIVFILAARTWRSASPPAPAPSTDG